MELIRDVTLRGAAASSRGSGVHMHARQMVSSAGSCSESIDCIGVTHGSTGRHIPGGRLQRRSNTRLP